MTLAGEIRDALADGGEMTSVEILEVIRPGLTEGQKRVMMRKVVNALGTMHRRNTVVKAGYAPYVRKLRLWRLAR